MKKRFISVILICTMIFMSFTACTNKTDDASATLTTTVATTTATTIVSTTTQPTQTATTTTQKATTTIPTTTKKNDEVLRNFSSLNDYDCIANTGKYSFHSDDVYYSIGKMIYKYNSKTKERKVIVESDSQHIESFKLFGDYILYSADKATHDYIAVLNLKTNETKILDNILYEFDYFLYNNYIFVCYKYIYGQNPNTDPRIYRYDLNAENIKESETPMTKNINSYSHILSGQYLFFNGYEPIEHESPGVEPDSAYLMSLNLKDGKVKKYDKSLKIIQPKDNYMQNNEWIMVKKLGTFYAMSTKTDKLVECPKNLRKNGIINNIMVSVDVTNNKIILTNLNNQASYTINHNFVHRFPNSILAGIDDQNKFINGGMQYYSQILTFNVSADKITVTPHQTSLKFWYDKTHDEEHAKHSGAAFYKNGKYIYYTDSKVLELDTEKNVATYLY